ncbi:major facilitator superfamily domain-containing protein [Trichoderma barbatum]
MTTVAQNIDDTSYDEKKRGSDVKAAATDTTDGQPQEILVDYQSDPQLRRLELLKQQYGSTWDRTDDPNDPYNWPPIRKVLTGITYSMAQLITLMTASIITAALNDITADLHIGMSSAQMIFSTYFLGLAFGPFVVAALSEMYGRKWIWVAGNVWYIVWNAISPVGKSVNMMIVSRLMAGFGACAGVTLTGPVMADMYGKRERGKAASITALLPSLGPALGPILGGIVTQLVEWPWIFRIMSIITSVITLLGVFYIKESYTPALLRRKTRGRPLKPQEALTWDFWSEFSNRLGLGIWRPVRLLLTRPIIQVIAFVWALSFGIYTLLLGTYATMFIDRYGQTPSISALHYIAIAVASTFAAQVGGRLMDWMYKRLSDRRNKGHGKPEFRVPYLIPGIVFLPIGLVMYGWAAEHTVAWPVVDIGTIIFTMGTVIVAQTLSAYQLDEFVEHGASASAATRVLAYVLGFAFPTFAPKLYSRFGYGWGNSMMALIWIVFCFPLPVILWLWGEKIRRWGRRDAEHQMEGV